MNSFTIRRFVTLLSLIIAVMCSVAAHAEPLPFPATGGTRSAGPAVIMPPQNGVLMPHTNIIWTDFDANYYAFKATVIETGEKWKGGMVPPSCDGSFCSWEPDQKFFDHVRDGQSVAFQVLAEFAHSPTQKGAIRVFTVQEAAAPALTAPSNFALLTLGQSLKWTNDPANMSYVLTVKSVATDKTLKFSILATSCASECGINVYQNNLGLESSTEYTWRVKATGFTGEKAKSSKRSFFSVS